MNIYVGNLAYSCTEDDLREAFSPYGVVDSARVITDKFSGQSKGFGFVEMSDVGAGQAAITALNGKPFKGREMKVNEARPKSDDGPGGGGGGRMDGGGGGRSGSRW